MRAFFLPQRGGGAERSDAEGACCIDMTEIRSNVLTDRQS
jgi:hypothetical protein